MSPMLDFHYRATLLVRQRLCLTRLDVGKPNFIYAAYYPVLPHSSVPKYLLPFVTLGIESHQNPFTYTRRKTR